ncbi:hypothetical protein BGZ46_001141 [Entomortierella lignicola]|nr:hypothetical protein BGZ46_001141 [Entomortierella lignicola]
MPPRVSIELSPSSSSATNKMTTLSTPTSPTPIPSKKSNILTTISTSPPGSATMDDATSSHMASSPSSSSSASFSSSPTSSPSSSTFSLSSSTPTPATFDKGKAKTNTTAIGWIDNKNIYNQDRESFHTGSQANQISDDVCTTQSSDILVPINNNNNNAANKQQSQYTLHHSQEPHIPAPQFSSADQTHCSNGKSQLYPPEYESVTDKGKGKGKGLIHSEYDQEETSSRTLFEQESSVSNYPSSSNLYTHPNARSSKSSSIASIDEEQESTATSHHNTSGKGKASDSGSGSGSGSCSSSGSSSKPISARPRVASASTYLPYSNGSGSGSGSCSKPRLDRSLTGPGPHQRPPLSFTASSSAVPLVPNLPITAYSEKEAAPIPDLSLYSYDAIPEDFDFGDLPFYDTDPRTGIIYGDPHSIIRPYLVPETYFDLYHLTHEPTDPRRTNIFNKHGGLVYYHPGRHIGQEQDSLRAQSNNQPIWTMAGRTSTWGNLTATEMSTKRQIRILMENNKKKAKINTDEPVARFVFRWKEDDFVMEYRKQKDQYRITCSQMCGGESKWKPPQPRPIHLTLHGTGFDSPLAPHATITAGTPSPFDATRYLQLVSEYRLNSGPVLKRGNFELHNPDTFPNEFKTFLMLVSIVILDVMRPVDDQLFLKEFPEAVNKVKVPKTGGLNASGGVVINGRVSHPIVMRSTKSFASTSASASASTLSVDRSSNNNASIMDLSLTNNPPVPLISSTKSMPISNNSASTNTKTEILAPVKKSRWGSIFKK